MIQLNATEIMANLREKLLLVGFEAKISAREGEKDIKVLGTASNSYVEQYFQ